MRQARAEGDVADAELLEHDQLGQRVGAAAAELFRQREGAQAEPGGLAEEVGRPGLGRVDKEIERAGARADTLGRELAGGRLELLLLFGE
jgi:hypothetical protein